MHTGIVPTICSINLCHSLFICVCAGTKYPTKVENFAKSNITLVMCDSASGSLLPLYVIYKSDYVYDQWVKGEPKGKSYCEDVCCAHGLHFNRSKSDWMDVALFSDWFFSTFLPRAERLHPDR